MAKKLDTPNANDAGDATPAAPAAKVASSRYRIDGVGGVSVEGVSVTADKNGILILTDQQVEGLAGHGYAVVAADIEKATE